MTDQTRSVKTAPPEVINLVNRFAGQRDVYRSGKYNETQLRRDFLDSLFKELGWDVDNRKNLSETNREVINEISVEMEGHSKAADYAFKTNNKISFFLEAKKPSVNIEANPAPAFQLRSYGWTAKLPFSVLSDFEQLAIYNCRIKPVYGDTPLIARHKLYTYTDYVDKWDEIYNLLSYEAVHAGSLDKLVETVKSKRGTADVDDDFLATMEHWREELARVISLRNLSLSQRQINTAVQLIIDRIIFLRICEDRGIEPENGLREATDGVDVYGDLMALFKKADKKYNSGLFHFDVEKGQSSHPDTLTPTLKIDDKVLKDILANLYLPKSPYAFKYFSADILGQVYERFLGKVITLSDGHRSKVIEKPEVRKAGGVYYTPTYIVEYIVRNTVGELLKDVTPAHMLVEPIRVLDPACGSGSFLLGSYQYLLDWYLSWYSANDPVKWSKGKNPPIFDNGGWQLTMEKKKEILTSHIFGVDIDAQAVEVTKLSLLLKVVENPGQLSILEERILPDLGENIQCGNSLIGPDYYQNQQLTMFDSEEQYRVNAFDWETSFRSVFKKGGFDAVIGNPPYGLVSEQELLFYYRNKFQYQDNLLDMYLLFLEKYHSLISYSKYFGVIISNTWLQSITLRNIRKYLTNQFKWSKLLFIPNKIFNAVVDTNVLIAKKTQDGIADADTIDIDYLCKTQTKLHHTLSGKYIPKNGDSINIIEDNQMQELINKINSGSIQVSNLFSVFNGTKPFEIGKGTPPQTKKVVQDHIFVHEGDKPNHDWSPLLRGSLINRYINHWNNDYWIQYGKWLAAPRDPMIFKAPLKIVVRQTGDSIIATLVDDRFIERDNLHIILPKENSYRLEYLLGILNSKIIDRFYTHINPEKGEALAQVKKKHIEILPVRLINFSDPAEVKQHDRMVALVESMLALHQASAAARLPDEKERLARQIQFTDRQIDQLVYQLYGLSEDEIQIVEGS